MSVWPAGSVTRSPAFTSQSTSVSLSSPKMKRILRIAPPPPLVVPGSVPRGSLAVVLLHGLPRDRLQERRERRIEAGVVRVALGRLAVQRCEDGARREVRAGEA